MNRLPKNPLDFYSKGDPQEESLSTVAANLAASIEKDLPNNKKVVGGETRRASKTVDAGKEVNNHARI